MPKLELTKRMLADTLKRLSAKKPIEKISIQEIVDTAGTNRQTFYYHFADKQALICWIFDTDVSGLTDKNQNNTLLDDIIEYLYSEKSFYTAALTSMAQNSLLEHIYEIIESRTTGEILALADCSSLPAREVQMLASYFSFAMVGMLIRWAQSGMKDSPEDFSLEYASLTAECLKIIVKRRAK